MNIEKHRAFLDSLEGEKKIYRLLEPENDEWSEGDGVAEITNLLPNQVPQWDIVSKFRSSYGYMIGKKVSALYIGRRAESRQIPNLKEKVKAFGIACMNAEKDSYETDGSVDFDAAGKRVEELRALFAPEVKP